MKKLGVFLLVITIISLGTGLFFTVFPVLPLAAKSFLWSVSNDQYDTAYEIMSPNFKEKVNPKEFILLVNRSGFNEYESVQWEREVIAKDKQSAFVQGVVITYNKKRIPVRFDFIHYEGESFLDKRWMIDRITILR